MWTPASPSRNPRDYDTTAGHTQPLLSIRLGRLSQATHMLTATYSGDTNYAAVTFGNYIVEVTPP